ncbi:MAG: response regulator [Myxococcales bacterium]
MTETVNILLVDDEQRNLDALEAVLDDPSYRLLRADGAEKALRLLLEHDVAAIVLDIKMPVVSGFELAKMIKGTKKFRQIPIVFLTAHLLEDQDVLMGYGAGAVDYLTKPVKPAILRHKIGIFADLYRKTRALAELNENLETRVRERTAELEKSEEALRAADAQKDLFLATLAHELRNPLAPLRTGLEILMHEPVQSTQAKRTLGAMERQLTHMVRLIDDLLDVNRISRGTLNIQPTAIELSRVIEDAIETSRPLIERRDQCVAFQAHESVRSAVDATRVTQIVGNLLNNASKFSPSGTTINIDLRRAGSSAVIRVTDHGLGIPPNQIDRIFAMFAKVERASNDTSDGLGIGLALSRQLAELHGGSLNVESAGEGKGSSFILTLPTGNLPKASERPSVVVAKRLPCNAALRVVVVEDNEDSAELMSTWLELLGHNVLVAHNGPDGLAAITETQPDVVLCDIGLPGMDGVELCRHVVRRMSLAPMMVALTGWGMEADRQRSFEAGFQHHLVKPVGMDQLRSLLQTVQRLDQRGHGPAA